MNFPVTSIETGVAAPGFCLPDQDGEEVCSRASGGGESSSTSTPRTNTRGCTLEAIDFTTNKDRIEVLGATVLGVSPDSVKSHQGFRNKQGLTLTLLSDPGHGVLEAYGVWQLKKSYGREYYGVVRSTFIIDPEGRIAHVWKRVRVIDHVEVVIKKLLEQQGV